MEPNDDKKLEVESEGNESVSKGVTDTVETEQKEVETFTKSKRGAEQEISEVEQPANKKAKRDSEEEQEDLSKSKDESVENDAEDTEPVPLGESEDYSESEATEDAASLDDSVEYSAPSDAD